MGTSEPIQNAPPEWPTDWTKPHWWEWFVARGLVYSKGARKWFRDGGYGPELFRCHVAKAVVGWSLLEREVIPGPIADLMVYREEPDGQTFAEFATTPLLRLAERDSIDVDDAQYEWQVRHYTTKLQGVRGL